MSEWNENKLDQELEALINEMPEQDDLEKKINQSIDRRIRKIVLRTVSAIAAVVLIAFLIINPLMNMIFFDPYKMNEEPNQKMLGVLRDYMETIQPYREVISLEVEKKGFARYDLAMQVADLTEPLVIGGPNVWCEVNFGSYENIIDSEQTLGQKAGRFACDYNKQEDMLEKISELPESATIYLSVSDTVPKSVEELRVLPVKTEWMQVYQPNVKFQGGLSLNPRVLYAGDDDRESMSGKELKEVYLSNLENILNNSEVWAEWGMCDGNGTLYVAILEILRDTYNDAWSISELTSENYCVWGQRDEVVQFLQENTLDSIYVENVRLW